MNVLSLCICTVVDVFLSYMVTKICTNFYSQFEGDRLLSLDDGRGLFEDGKGLFDDGNLFLVEGLFLE